MDAIPCGNNSTITTSSFYIETMSKVCEKLD